MAIAGVSGSPIQCGNTDRQVQSLLEKSGHVSTLINLSSLEFMPCRGRAHLRAKFHFCPIEGGLRPYYEPILEADALILAEVGSDD